MNTAGPFQFDTKSIPDYRQSRQSLFEQLPVELIVKCLSFTSPQQVLKFFHISKWLSSVASDNAIWKRLFLLKWPLQNSNLKLKSWMTLYERRYEAEKRYEAEEAIHRVQKGPTKFNAKSRRYPNGVNFIENCRHEFDCPLTIEDLNLCQQQSGLECQKCQKFVNQVNDEAAIEKYAAIGPYVKMKRDTSIGEQAYGFWTANEQQTRPTNPHRVQGRKSATNDNLK
jgi:hypothetical protein